MRRKICQPSTAMMKTSASPTRAYCRNSVMEPKRPTSQSAINGIASASAAGLAAGVSAKTEARFSQISQAEIGMIR